MSKLTGAKRWLNLSQESEQKDIGPNQTDTEVSGVVNYNNGEPEKEELGNTENAEEIAKVSKEALEIDDDSSAEELEDEIEDRQDQIEEIEDEIDTLEEAKASLEAFHDAFLVSRDEGGVSPQAFKFAKLGLERYADLLPESSQELSVESFGGTSDRHTHTQLSIEGFKETIAKLWEAIKKAIQTVLDLAKNQFGQLVVAFGNVGEKAAKVSKLAKALGNKQAPSGATVGLAGQGVLFNYKGAYIAKIADTVTNAKNAITKFYGDNGPAATLLQAAQVQAFGTKGDEAALTSALVAFDKAVPEAADLDDIGLITRLPGNTALYVVTGGGEIAGIKFIASKFDKDSKFIKAPANAQKPVGSASDVAKRVDEIVKVSGDLGNFNFASASTYKLLGSLLGKTTKAPEFADKTMKDALEIVNRYRLLVGAPQIQAYRQLNKFLSAQLVLAQRELKILAGKGQDQKALADESK